MKIFNFEYYLDEIYKKYDAVNHLFLFNTEAWFPEKKNLFLLYIWQDLFLFSLQEKKSFLFLNAGDCFSFSSTSLLNVFIKGSVLDKSRLKSKFFIEYFVWGLALALQKKIKNLNTY